MSVLKCINFAVLTPSRIGVYNEFKREYRLFLVKDIDRIFDDKLINLSGYRYKVAGFEQFPRLYSRKGRIIGVDKMFLELVATKQNATIQIDWYGDTWNSSINLKMLAGQLDIMLNTRHNGEASKVQKILKPVQTYDEHAWCALIPSPRQISYLRFLLTPFDGLLWVLLASSVAATTTIWQLYKRFHPRKDDVDSVGTLILGIFAFFFLQGISFRKNTPVLTLLLHIFSFVLAFLGNAYQSSLISLIHEQQFEPKISSIDEMMTKYDSFISDVIFDALKMESEMYRQMKTTSIAYDKFQLLNFKELAAKKTVLIFSCDYVEAALTHIFNLKHGQLEDSYYVLHEKLFASFEKLLTSAYSPFHKRLNEISSKVFESGIRQHWKVLLEAELTKKRIDDAMHVEEEKHLLNIKDMIGILTLCGICWLASLLVFSLEWMWNGFMTKTKLGEKLKRVFCGKPKKKPRKQQAFEMETVIFPYLE
jgi:hypothetical protein